jgi:hypothetical protein
VDPCTSVLARWPSPESHRRAVTRAGHRTSKPSLLGSWTHQLVPRANGTFLGSPPPRIPLLIRRQNERQSRMTFSSVPPSSMVVASKLLFSCHTIPFIPSLRHAGAPGVACCPAWPEPQRGFKPQWPPCRPSAADACRPRLHPVQAPKLDRGEPLVNPHHFPVPSRRRTRRILDFPADRCARGLHGIFPVLSREISVNQGPLRNFRK